MRSLGTAGRKTQGAKAGRPHATNRCDCLCMANLLIVDSRLAPPVHSCLFKRGKGEVVWKGEEQGQVARTRLDLYWRGHDAGHMGRFGMLDR